MKDERSRWQELFLKAHDGSISPAEHAELAQLLSSSPEARQAWFLQCDLETGLSDWAATRSAAQRDAVPADPAPRLERKLAAWWAPLAAAALLMLGAYWWWGSRGGTAKDELTATKELAAPGIAVLLTAAGAEWSDGFSRAAGSVLEPGPIRLRSGAIAFQLFSGAKVILQAPAELHLVSPGEVALREGRVRVHVPPQAKGFTVSTDGFRVVDLGTEFGVALPGTGAPVVHVFEGVVEVSGASLPSRRLSAGEAIMVREDSYESIPAVSAEFVAEAEVLRRGKVDEQARRAAWESGAARVSGDSAALVHYTFDSGSMDERGVVNQVFGANKESHGAVVGAHWTIGRWPGKGAIEFRGAIDRVRFVAPPIGNVVTLLAWVRVNSLSRAQSVVVASDSDQPGALRWHLTGAGELRLEIARNLGRSHADWEAVNSRPFLTSERMGQWTLIATTFDGGTVRHYGNGELIGSGASFRPPQLHLGSAELGNWLGNTQRQLHAVMDEFAVFARVLSGEEIRAIFEAGRP